MKKSRIHDLKNKFFTSALAGCWNTVKDSKKTLFCTMLIDLLFLCSLYLLNILANSIFPDPSRLLVGASSKIFLVIVLMLVYVFMIIMAYSFFKFMIIRKVRSLFVKGKEYLDFSSFDSFLFSNILLLGLFFMISVFISLISITTIRIEALTTVRDVFLIVIGLFAYLTVNAMHSLFAQGIDHAGTAIKRSLNMVIGRFSKFIPIIIFTVAAFFILSGAYYLFDWTLLKILGTAVTNPSIYLVYASINTILIFIFAFGLVAFNRVYFYILISKIKSIK